MGNRNPDGTFAKGNQLSLGNKGGRPSGDKEFREQFKAAYSPAQRKRIFKALGNKCEEGDVPAIRLWLSYLGGLPVQMLEGEERKDINVRIDAAVERIYDDGEDG